MRVVYQIINFLILGGILFLVGRKAVTKMINSRKERISAEQEEAEAGTRRAERARGLLAQQEAENAEKLEKLKAEEEKRIRRIAEESSRRAERRAAELRASTDDAVAGEKLRSVSHIMRDTSAKLIPAVSALLSSEPYAGRFRKREPELLDAILPRIALTPGDRSYIMQYGVLYVTVQSAFRLDDGLVSKAEKSVSALVAEAGGKISFRYEVEEKLIGGLRIKVGDTVYDATLKNALYGLGVRLREYGTDGGLDPEKEEGPDGYAVFAALTQTAETEIKPDRNPAKRIRSGKEEQRNEREMTFGANQKNRIVSQRSVYDPEKEEGPDVYVVFAALTQTAETE